MRVKKKWVNYFNFSYNQKSLWVDFFVRFELLVFNREMVEQKIKKKKEIIEKREREREDALKN